MVSRVNPRKLHVNITDVAACQDILGLPTALAASARFNLAGAPHRKMEKWRSTQMCVVITMLDLNHDEPRHPIGRIPVNKPERAQCAEQARAHTSKLASRTPVRARMHAHEP